MTQKHKKLKIHIKCQKYVFEFIQNCNIYIFRKQKFTYFDYKGKILTKLVSVNILLPIDYKIYFIRASYNMHFLNYGLSI